MPPPNPNPDPEAQQVVNERQVEDAAESQNHGGGNGITRASGMSVHFSRAPPLIYLLAENYCDPSGKLWSMYLTEAEEEDVQLAKKWTEDTGTILVFVSSNTPVYSCPMPEQIL